MRGLERRGWSLKIGSGDDPILACSGASVAALCRLVSVSPSHKAFGPAFRQRNVHLVHLPETQISFNEHGVDLDFYEE
jgi:hypothetical protein